MCASRATPVGFADAPVGKAYGARRRANASPASSGRGAPSGAWRATARAQAWSIAKTATVLAHGATDWPHPGARS
eukprot:4923493-Prymnesium_polylepis.1